MPGRHWVAIFVDTTGHADYFDSLGDPPLPIFHEFLERHSMAYSYFTGPVQSEVSRSCGAFCIYFLHFRALGKSMQEVASELCKFQFHFRDRIVDTFVIELERKRKKSQLVNYVYVLQEIEVS